MILETNIDTFDSDVTDKKGVALVFFGAPWDAHSTMLGMKLTKVDAERGDSARILKVNVDEELELTSRFKVQTIPRMLLFKDGLKMESLLGNQPKSVIDQALDKYL